MKHTKQFYLVDKNYDLILNIKGFNKRQFNRYTLFYHSDLSVLEMKDGSLFLGTVFTNQKDYEGLNPRNFLDKCDNLGGRWTYISNDFIFTDFLATKSIYYSNKCNVISTSLGILRDLKEIDSIDLNYSKSYKAFIPPSTEYENIRQLLPGEYIDLRAKKLISHGPNYFDINRSDEVSSLDSMSKLMRSYVDSCQHKIREKGYYQGLTGGTDSRLTLSSFLMSSKKHYTITHCKPYLFMTESDLKIPIMLSEKFSFNHDITYKTKTKFDINSYLEHIGRSVDSSIGSCLYYFINGQMDLLEDRFFIDNYYEVGAKWLHDIGQTGKSNIISLDSIKKDKYNIKDEDVEYFLNHIKSISGDNIDHRDILYFLKNFSKVNQIFCELDYCMYPIVHMNSRRFFSALLSTPEHLRAKKLFLNKLIKHNVPELEEISINKRDPKIKDFIFRVHRKLTRML